MDYLARPAQRLAGDNEGSVEHGCDDHRLANMQVDGTPQPPVRIDLATARVQGSQALFMPLRRGASAGRINRP